MNACKSDACQEGRKPCPTPQACELPVSFVGDEPAAVEEAAARALLRIGLFSILAIVLMAFFAGLLVGAFERFLK